MLRFSASPWLLFACGLVAVSGWSSSQGDEPAAIPLKRVVMFSSGVAFFERGGEVTGKSTVDLKFNVRDINDLLKSMVLQDLGGGKISTVSYGSKDPLTRTLQTFAIDLTQNLRLADLLNQIRGEKIEIEAPAKVEGTIVGIERRKVKSGESVVEVDFLNLLTEDGLRSVSLENVSKIKLANPKLDAELRLALTVLAQSHSTDKKSVTLNFLGEGKRQVRVGYIQESPIWKTSYRLVLDDEEKPLLQGWAIVENTTEEEWNNVALTLVSGRPISFVMDLYEPVYVGRPEEKLELYASLRPKTYEQDLASANRDFRQMAQGGEGERKLATLARSGARQDESLRERAAFAAAPPAAKSPALGEYVNDPFSSDKFDGRKGFQSAAQAAELGEMFQYTIATPVTVARQRSAMLPIVNESVQADRVSIYNPSVHGKHPLHGLKLKNTTDLHLMQGPITVFADGAYAGDAKIQDLPSGSERLLSYAMDLDTEVAPTSTNEPEQLLAVRINSGTLHLTRKYARKQAYVIKNSSKKKRQVLIEYPLDTSWTLIEPKEASEKTRNEYRFVVAADPGKPANLTIREERTAGEAIALTNLDDRSIAFFLGQQVVSAKVKDALQEIIKRKQAINQASNRRRELERQIEVIFAEQGRIRQNMAQLPKDSDLFNRYVKKFLEQEDAVEKLRGEVQGAIAEEQKLQKSLNEYLTSLDLT